MRHNLKAEIKISILANAAPPCEICLEPTTFARFTDIGRKKVGRFAHVHAVQPKGARYDPNYPKEKIDSQENVFWCCADCHDIVDYREKWDYAKLTSILNDNRNRRPSSFQVIIDGEISVTGHNAENITGIDAGGKPTMLQPGTKVNVQGTNARNITGIKT